MANAVYDKAREGLLNGNIKWGDVHSRFLAL